MSEHSRGPGRWHWRHAITIPAVALGLLAAACTATAPSPEGFADLVDRVRPAVVNVAAVLRPVRSRPDPDLDIPPELRGTPFEEFLRQLLELPSREEENSRPTISLGSGFIVESSGYVVTSTHVIQNASKIQITLADGSRIPAQVIGRDEETDLALLKVEAATPLPYVTWGDSDRVRVGDWVVAVGNPFGLGGTVTAGIISARGRDIQSGRFDDYLQIDAPINRGNSGGPSFDRHGAVIGVNSAIFSSAGGSIGIGFAIPSALARPVLQELREHGRIERGWLGVAFQPVTREIADSLDLEEAAGVLVISVVSEGPAAKAGLRSGDVIRSVDGQKIFDTRDLSRRVGFSAPERLVELDVWRDGRAVAIAAVLGRTPSIEGADVEPPLDTAPPVATSPSLLLGLSLTRISPETQQRYGLPPGAKGVLVVGVMRGSAAAEAGILPGDILVTIGNKPVGEPRDFEAATADARAAGRKALLLLVQRRSGAERFVAIAIP